MILGRDYGVSYFFSCQIGFSNLDDVRSALVIFLWKKKSKTRRKINGIKSRIENTRSAIRIRVRRALKIARHVRTYIVQCAGKPFSIRSSDVKIERRALCM